MKGKDGDLNCLLYFLALVYISLLVCICVGACLPDGYKLIVCGIFLDRCRIIGSTFLVSVGFLSILGWILRRYFKGGN